MNKATMLLDNISNDKSLKSAHGLSIFIEYNGLKILMDTGPNEKILHNAQMLSINLSKLNGIIISHGHSDHGGGLDYLDLSNQTIYSSDKVFNPKYLNILGVKKYVGMPKKINKDTFQYISQMTEIYPNVFIVPLSKSTHVTKNLYMANKDTIILDDFSDEIALVLVNNDDISVFTGCSHHGIVDIIKEIKNRFPNKHIKRVIGGFHMIGIPYVNNLGMKKIEIKKIGDELNNIGVEHFYTCHCTGMKAYNLLKPILKDKLSYLSAGESVHFN